MIDWSSLVERGVIRMDDGFEAGTRQGGILLADSASHRGHATFRCGTGELVGFSSRMQWIKVKSCWFWSF